MLCSMQDYGFGAFNSTSTDGLTHLTARILSRRTDEAALRDLACDAQVNRALSTRRLKFGEPSAAKLGVVLGPERVFMQTAPCEGPEGTTLPLVPIVHLGSLSREQVDALLVAEPGKEHGFRDMDDGLSLFLRAGEIQQVFLRIIPREPDAPLAYAVQVDHWLSGAKDTYIGGLMALFVTPHDPF
jgi:hypothetical protein